MILHKAISVARNTQEDITRHKFNFCAGFATSEPTCDCFEQTAQIVANAQLFLLASGKKCCTTFLRFVAGSGAPAFKSFFIPFLECIWLSIPLFLNGKLLNQESQGPASPGIVLIKNQSIS